MIQTAKQRGNQETKEQYMTTADYLKMTRNQRRKIEMNPERKKNEPEKQSI